jgi:hypothetical protein
VNTGAQARAQSNRTVSCGTSVHEPVVLPEFEAVDVISPLTVQTFGLHSGFCICFGAQALSGGN